MGNASGASGRDLEPAIIYEDERILAVDKPAGLVVHTDGRTEEPSLAEWVLARHPALGDIGGKHTLDSGRYVPRAGILHRLDRETSGVIVVAKDDEVFYFLQRQFLDRTVEKAYNAFVCGVPDPREGMIDLPLGRSKTDFRQWATESAARGTLRKAVTVYKVLRTDGAFSFLELRPKTGRTHQLRVHMKAIGHPIVCDKRYGSACALGFTRLALHATTLALKLPGGERKVFTAPLPGDFTRALLAFR